MKQNEMIAVKYYDGEQEECSYIVTLFVTFDEQIAIDYVNKFNSILEKWKNYYKQFEEDGWIKEEFEAKHFRRWFKVHTITRCYYTKIEVR